MEYEYDQKPNTVFTDESNHAIEKIGNSEYSVLVGRNNCGKSYLLKLMTTSLGKKASYLGPARYQNFHTLGMYTPNKNRKNEKWNQFVRQFQNEHQNIDNSPLNLQQAIAELNDVSRNKLFEMVELLLGSKIEIKQTVSNNEMSQKYISCDGHNISFTSSGFRLITTLLTCLLDTEYTKFLIDEPELGISPEAQGILADFLFNKTYRVKYFPHIETIIFATHSTIFLDRGTIQNNYSVTKSGDIINISQVADLIDFNRIHFFLLGNRFETLYLPSAIILVEGKCDHLYLSRVLELEFPDARFSVINATSDGRMKEVVSMAKDLFTDIQKSPYRERIIPVLDSIHERGIVPSLTSMGLKEDSVVVWSKNGIEYFYPASAVDLVFGTGTELEITDDIVSRNGITYKKTELAGLITSKINEATEYPEEFVEKFIKKIEAKTGLARRCRQ